MRTSRILLAALIALFVLQAIYYYPRLPDYLASNFAGDGTPNAYSSKTGYAVVSFSMLALMLGSLVGLPAYFARQRPERLLKGAPSLPRDELRRRAEWILGQLVWAAVLTAAFVVIVNQMVLGANLSPQPRLSGLFLPALLGYMVSLLALVARLIRSGLKHKAGGPV